MSSPRVVSVSERNKDENSIWENQSARDFPVPADPSRRRERVAWLGVTEGNGESQIFTLINIYEADKLSEEFRVGNPLLYYTVIYK